MHHPEIEVIAHQPWTGVEIVRILRPPPQTGGELTASLVTTGRTLAGREPYVVGARELEALDELRYHGGWQALK